MSVLDGRQLVTVSGTSYLVQNPPHGESPWSQNAAFNSALAAGASGANVLSVSASTTLTVAQAKSQVYFSGSTTGQTITLPAASTASGVSFKLTMLGTGSGGLSVTSAAGNIKANGLADGLTRTLPVYAASGNMTVVELYCNGTNWFLVSYVCSSSIT